MENLFHRWRVQPGGPLWLGVKGDVLVFGLPGNPAASFVGFEILVVPAIRHALGLALEARRRCVPGMGAPGGAHSPGDASVRHDSRRRPRENSGPRGSAGPDRETRSRRRARRRSWRSPKTACRPPATNTRSSRCCRWGRGHEPRVRPERDDSAPEPVAPARPRVRARPREPGVGAALPGARPPGARHAARSRALARLRPGRPLPAPARARERRAMGAVGASLRVPALSPRVLVAREHHARPSPAPPRSACCRCG